MGDDETKIKQALREATAEPVRWDFNGLPDVLEPEGVLPVFRRHGVSTMARRPSSAARQVARAKGRRR